MSNEYFDSTLNRVSNGTTARGQDVNNVIDATEAAFDLLPTPEQIWAGTESAGPAGGTVNAITLTLGGQTPVPYIDGQSVTFLKLSGDNTGACTLAVDSGSPKPLVAYNGGALVASDLVTGRWYEARFVETDDEWRLANNISTGGLDAAVTDAETAASNALNSASSAAAASLLAFDQKGYAEEWAQAAEDTPVSVSAGGDGATDFSALHWAAKSADSAAEAAATLAAKLENIVEDTTPQLGGDLDIGAFNITGDFSAAASARPSFVSKTTDGSTVVQVKPNGAGDGAFVALYGLNDPDNSHRLVFVSQSASNSLTSAASGTGVLKPFDLVMDATSRFRMDTTGRFILGDVSADMLAASAGGVTISTGDSGVTTVGNADDLLIESDGIAGIVIATPNTDSGQLRFVDPESSIVCIMRYDHPSDEYSIYSGVTDTVPFRIDSTGRVVIGSVGGIGGGPDLRGAGAGSLTVSTADSGVTSVNTAADDLIIEGTGNVGITIASPNTAYCSVRFADPESVNPGMIRYYHVDDSMDFYVNGAVAFTIESNGTLVANTTNYETLVTGDDDIPNRKFVADFAMPGVFTASGSDDVTDSAGLVTFDAEVIDPAANYSLAAGVITVAAAGYYEISYSVALVADDDTGDLRSAVDLWVERDTGSGFSAIAQSYSTTYLRETASGVTSGGGGAATFICQLTAADEIKLQTIQKYALVNGSTVAGRQQLSIKRIG